MKHYLTEVAKMSFATLGLAMIPILPVIAQINNNNSVSYGSDSSNNLGRSSTAGVRTVPGGFTDSTTGYRGSSSLSPTNNTGFGSPIGGVGTDGSNTSNDSSTFGGAKSGYGGSAYDTSTSTPVYGTPAYGNSTSTSGTSSSTSGDITTAPGYGTPAYGRNTTAPGYGTSTYGNNTTASGDGTSAYGNNTPASGDRTSAPNAPGAGGPTLGNSSGIDESTAIGVQDSKKTSSDKNISDNSSDLKVTLSTGTEPQDEALKSKHKSKWKWLSLLGLAGLAIGLATLFRKPKSIEYFDESEDVVEDFHTRR